MVLLSLKQAILHSSCLPPPSRLRFFTHCRVPKPKGFLWMFIKMDDTALNFSFISFALQEVKSRILHVLGKWSTLRYTLSPLNFYSVMQIKKKTRQIHKYSMKHQILGDQLQNQYEQKQNL